MAALAMMRSEGLNESEAIRVALHEAGERRRRGSELRLEQAAVPDDADELLALSTVLV